MKLWIRKPCAWCGSPFLVRHDDETTRFCSYGCVASYGNSLRGIDSKSGWRKKARAVFVAKNGNPVCETCGSYAADVHHKNGDMTDNRICNLIALCRSCHTAHHNHLSPKRKPSGRIVDDKKKSTTNTSITFPAC